ncbi:von Willebrand factor A [Thiomicrospira aerophila AL3]|uniref:von Willebrand factor A n=1 Tax=Thiomicrospira aerophila AL3 TaxID=717772 RepID=W0DYT6_9GAMM|nr:VWA domain-containing protein [Thiomicrospira aerophila]AHF02149.1 von Willebrand factor A [Thiomicrospira aerophila AL3]
MSGIADLLSAFHFIWPALILIAPLPWLVRRYLKPAAQEQQPLVAPTLGQRLRNFIAPQQTLVDDAQGAKMHHVSLHLAFAIIWLLLILAAMRPVWYITPAPFEASGRDMMLSIDISPTMLREDMSWQGQRVDRLVALKRVMDEFITQRQGDRMGLIVFSTEAHLVSPLTYDLQAINQLMMESEVGMAGNTTAIGDSIGLAIKHLSEQQNDRAVLVLLTDGANNDGFLDPIEAAEKAAEMGLIIHTIAFGNIDTSRGRPVSSAFDIDLEALEKISGLTGGRSFAAGDAQTLRDIYRTINELEANTFELNHYRARHELFIWPLGLALLLSWLIAVYRLVRSELAHV